MLFLKNLDYLLELFFLPLYGSEKGEQRRRLAKDVIEYEIQLIKKDQFFKDLFFATLVICNKLIDKETL